MKLKLLVVLMSPFCVMASDSEEVKASSSCVSESSNLTIVTQCNNGMVTAVKGDNVIVCNATYDQDLPPVCTKVSLYTKD